MHFLKPVTHYFIALAVLFSWSALAQTTDTQLTDLKPFVHDLIQISTLQKDAQGTAFRTLISQNRAIVEKVVSGKFETELKTSNLSELGVGTSLMNLDTAISSKGGASNWLVKKFVAIRIKLFGYGFVVDRVQRMSDIEVRTFFDRIDVWIAELDPTELPAFKQFMGLLKKPKGGSPLFQLIEKALPIYLRELPLNMRKNQLLAFLGTATPISGLIQNSGVVPQKILQLLYSDLEPGLLKEEVGAILSEVDPFPGEIARTIVEEELGRPISEVFEHFEMTPMKAGTIGQIHRVRLIGGAKGVVKVLRPGIHEQIQLEFTILRKAVQGTPFVKLLDSIEASFLKQANFIREAKETDLAQVEFMDLPEGITVSSRLPGFDPKVRVLFLSEEDGVPLYEVLQSDLSESQLKDIGKKLLALYEFWLEKAIYKTGFIHSDLHAGNILAKLLSNEAVKMTILDFGDSTRIMPEMQKAIISLSVSVAALSPDLAEKALNKLIVVPESKKTEFRIVLEQTIGNENVAPEKRLKEALKGIAELDVMVPSELVDFARSQAMILGAIKGVNKKLEQDLFKSSDVYKTLAKRYWTSAVTADILLDAKVRALLSNEVKNIWGVCENIMSLFNKKLPVK